VVGAVILDDAGCQADGCIKWEGKGIAKWSDDSMAGGIGDGAVRSSPSAQKSLWFCQCTRKPLGGGRLGIKESMM
jgi:hypothetical protein